MLTPEQQQLMDDILTSNTRLSNDQETINHVSALVDNNQVSKFEVLVNDGEYAQTIIAVVGIGEPFTWHCYTPSLITGVNAESITASQAKLDAEIQVQITDKLAELKLII